MVIDVHTHIFPAFIREARGSFFHEEPGFRSLYGEPESRLAGRGELLRSMDEEGVDVSVVFGFPWEKEDLFRRHNDYIIESVQRHPDRLIGLSCFSPFSPLGPAETERCLQSGLSGVGELAVYDRHLSSKHIPLLKDVMELCLGRDVPLLLHTNEPVGHLYPGKSRISLRFIYEFVKAYPSNKIILAHWGGGLFFYGLMKKEVKEVFRNTWFDTAASPYLYRPEVYRVAEEIIGAEKILFGSDYPMLRPGRYLKEMGSLILSSRAFDRITGKNAARLLKISP